MALDPGELFDVRGDDRGADPPRGQCDQQVVHDAESVPEPASVTMQGPEEYSGTVEQIGRRGDQTLAWKGALDSIDRSTAWQGIRAQTELHEYHRGEKADGPMCTPADPVGAAA